MAAAEAQEEFASAQTAAERRRQDVAANLKRANELAPYLNDCKAMREDLDHLAGMHRAACDQLAKLQASEVEHTPRVELGGGGRQETRSPAAGCRLEGAWVLPERSRSGSSRPGSSILSPTQPH
jgi:hypothetical protein